MIKMSWIISKQANDKSINLIQPFTFHIYHEMNIINQTSVFLEKPNLLPVFQYRKHVFIVKCFHHIIIFVLISWGFRLIYTKYTCLIWLILLKSWILIQMLFSLYFQILLTEIQEVHLEARRKTLLCRFIRHFEFQKCVYKR